MSILCFTLHVINLLITIEDLPDFGVDTGAFIKGESKLVEMKHPVRSIFVILLRLVLSGLCWWYPDTRGGSLFISAIRKMVSFFTTVCYVLMASVYIMTDKSYGGGESLIFGWLILFLFIILVMERIQALINRFFHEYSPHFTYFIAYMGLFEVILLRIFFLYCAGSWQVAKNIYESIEAENDLVISSEYSLEFFLYLSMLVNPVSLLFRWVDSIFCDFLESRENEY